MSPTMTASELTATLRGHYLAPNRPAGGLFAAEVGSPNGKRRADALWLPLTTAGGRELTGHELKVTRSDVLAELADPTKSDPWARYCGRWWLVVSEPELVEGLDIPEAWGIMAPPSGRRTRSMTILREAPKLEPMDPSPGLRRLLAWHFYGQADTVNRVKSDLSYAKRRIEQLEAQLAEARVTNSGHASPNTKRIAGIIHQADKAARDGGLWSGVPDAVIVDAIIDATRVAQAAGEVRHGIERLVQQLDDPLKRALDVLRKVGVELP